MAQSTLHALWREAVEWVITFCFGVVFYALFERGTSWDVFITFWLAGTAVATVFQWRRRRRDRQVTP